ncbi:hypothetical protein AB0I84_15715 [Streptomyces spectabilis]|uniref:hypothetical protein n=1 Tax=Streptomyces spectabilis TaxID=68270 RepID=UPI0033F47E3D
MNASTLRVQLDALAKTPESAALAARLVTLGRDMRACFDLTHEQAQALTRNVERGLSPLAAPAACASAPCLPGRRSR